MSLFKRRFREELHSLLSWGITLFLAGLGIMLLGMVINKVNIAEFGAIIDRMPAAIKNMFGGFFDAEMAVLLYLLGMAYNTIAPILLLVFISLAVLGMYTREAGQGNLEFLFSLPVSRWRLIAHRIAVLLLNLGLLLICLSLGTALGALLTGETLDPTQMAWANVQFFLLFFLLGGLAFLLSLTTADYSRGSLLVLGVLLALFLLNIGLGENGNSVLVTLNPFHYADVMRIFRGLSLPWREMLGFALSGLTFWGVGTYLYTHKQI